MMGELTLSDTVMLLSRQSKRNVQASILSGSPNIILWMTAIYHRFYRCAQPLPRELII